MKVFEIRFEWSKEQRREENKKRIRVNFFSVIVVTAKVGLI